MLMPTLPPLPLPDDAAMFRTLSRSAVGAGRAYAARGAVRHLSTSADGHVIEAEVKGTAKRPYVLRITLQRRCDKRAAKRLLRKLLKRQCRVPRVMITDKLPSYGAAKREVMSGVSTASTRA